MPPEVLAKAEAEWFDWIALQEDGSGAPGGFKRRLSTFSRLASSSNLPLFRTFCVQGTTQPSGIGFARNARFTIGPTEKALAKVAVLQSLPMRAYPTKYLIGLHQRFRKETSLPIPPRLNQSHR